MTISARDKTIKFQKLVSERLSQLFEIHLSKEDNITELHKALATIVNINGGDNGSDISVHRVLECINEPKTFYYQNDELIERFSEDRGDRIYSPRIDLGIAPSFVRAGERKGRCFMNILLPEGSRLNIYGLFERTDIIRNLKQMIKSKSEENYRLIDIIQSDCIENRSPLYLFGIEIENNPGKKYLMGDFLNSYLLSKNPVVLVPESKLNDALRLIKYIHVIKGLKGIDFTYLSQVNLLTIKQFNEIINDLLRQNNLPEIDLDNYE